MNEFSLLIARVILMETAHKSPELDEVPTLQDVLTKSPELKLPR